MLSCNTYHLTWVSLTLGVGYLFTAAPAKCSCFSLPWTRGISSLPLLLTLKVESLLLALLCLHSRCSLDVGLLLLAATPDLGHGVARLSLFSNELLEKCKKAKWLSGEALKIAVKRREAKSKGEKERYKHLNAEFQRIARR